MRVRVEILRGEIISCRDDEEDWASIESAALRHGFNPAKMSGDYTISKSRRLTQEYTKAKSNSDH